MLVTDAGVALLAEGVDRNIFWLSLTRDCILSPSSRRAWIEILIGLDVAGVDVVALLAEGVDRNVVFTEHHHAAKMSPSSRRAWIEIAPCNLGFCLRPGRPPRGGRG